MIGAVPGRTSAWPVLPVWLQPESREFRPVGS